MFRVVLRVVCLEYLPVVQPGLARREIKVFTLAADGSYNAVVRTYVREGIAGIRGHRDGSGKEQKQAYKTSRSPPDFRCSPLFLAHLPQQNQRKT